MQERNGLGLREVVAIGVGGMVGGGIFAVLGLSVELTKGAAPLAFAMGGVVALLTAYSYTKLSVAFPSKGGTVTFLNRAFGSGVFFGALNVLLWITHIVRVGRAELSISQRPWCPAQQILRHSEVSFCR